MRSFPEMGYCAQFLPHNFIRIICMCPSSCIDMLFGIMTAVRGIVPWAPPSPFPPTLPEQRDGQSSRHPGNCLLEKQKNLLLLGGDFNLIFLVFCCCWSPCPEAKNMLNLAGRNGVTFPPQTSRSKCHCFRAKLQFPELCFITHTASASNVCHRGEQWGRQRAKWGK